MTVGDLVAFLNARLDEDEQVAHWIADRDEWGGIHVEGPTEVASHINRHDPARVLAEVEAKRAILNEHPPNDVPYAWVKCSRCVETMSGRYQEDWEPQKYPCQTLRILASVYADHPDYDLSWKPDTD